MKKLILYIALFFSFAISAQEKDKTLPKANDEYAQNNFVEAEANYRISHSKFPKRIVAPYNLGNAIYKQNQPSEAKIAYATALANTKSRAQKHKIFHNLGNVFMKEKDYSAAVEAYKNALRNKPSDEETRYNYALAKKMLKEHPPKGGKDKNKDKDKDKNKDKKDGEKEKKDNKNNEDKDKKDDKGNNDKDKKEEKPQEDGKPKPIPGGISKQRTENLLDAVNNEEKKVQDKVNAKKVKGKPVQTEKDW